MPGWQQLGNLPADWSSDRARVACVPVGSFEWHGSHLPLDTSTRIATELASRIASQVDGMVVNPIGYGPLSRHLLNPGEISISGAASQQILIDIVGSLGRSGTQVVAFVNGNPMANFWMSGAIESSSGQGVSVVKTPSPDQYVECIVSSLTFSSQDPATAGGLAETSMMLALSPELVHLEDAVLADDTPAAPDFEWTASSVRRRALANSSHDLHRSSKDVGENLLAKLTLVGVAQVTDVYQS